jgi:hypothetical protein
MSKWATADDRHRVTSLIVNLRTLAPVLPATR